MNERLKFYRNRNLSELYRQLSKKNIQKYITPVWDDYNSALEKQLLPKLPYNFLAKREIAGSMFVDERGDWMQQQIQLLEMHYSRDALNYLLQENQVGSPNIASKRYNTSHNSIHHLYHLARYEIETGTKLTDIQTVVEWGGGYGNLAKIYRRLNPYSHTYIIIDTPLFICLQKAYLTSTLSASQVNVVDSSAGIVPGVVNLLPVGEVSRIDLSADIFISTWAISESSKFSQDYVSKNKYFDSKKLLIAYQDSTEELPIADRVAKLAKKAGAQIYDLEFLPHSHYVFR